MLRGHLGWRGAVEGARGVTVPAVLPPPHSCNLHRVLLSGCHPGSLEISQVSFIIIAFMVSYNVLQRCSEYDRGVSLRQQRHNPVSPFHSPPGPGIVCQVSWSPLASKWDTNWSNYFSVSRSRQTATWTQESRGRQSGTRGTCLGGKTVYKWPVWKARKPPPSYVPVNNFGMFGFSFIKNYVKQIHFLNQAQEQPSLFGRTSYK